VRWAEAPVLEELDQVSHTTQDNVQLSSHRINCLSVHAEIMYGKKDSLQVDTGAGVADTITCDECFGDGLTDVVFAGGSRFAIDHTTDNPHTARDISLLLLFMFH